MNHPSILNRCPQIPSRLGLEIYPVETLNNAATLKSDGEDMVFANEVAELPHQLDDLTAVVKKWNPKPQVASIPITSAMVRDCAHESELFPKSSDWTERYRKVQHAQSGVMNKRQQIRAQFGKRRRAFEEGEQKSHEFVVACTASSAARENHILLERLRRNEMTHLFSQLRSLLPNPTSKSDKASIVSETINYIQSLKQRLAISSKKGDIKLPPKHPGSSIAPLKSENMNPVIERAHTPPSDCCSNFCDENLTLNYNADDIFITLKSDKRLNLLSSILLGIESQNIQMVNAFVSATDAIAFYSLHVKSRGILDPVAKDKLNGTLNNLLRKDSHVLVTLAPRLQGTDPSCPVI